MHTLGLVRDGREGSPRDTGSGDNSQEDNKSDAVSSVSSDHTQSGNGRSRDGEVRCGVSYLSSQNSVG